ncbi:MAG: guanylate kinase [Desulfobacterales bacterium]|nr:guanylate kinase [Desulfobacterales bacterium]
MRGELFIISAPSGAGKTTLLKKVMAGLPGLAFSVSHTTRPPRAGEKNGVDYHFVGRETFRTMRDSGEFLEWAEVHGNFYGTSRQAVEAGLARGLDVVLDIDVQGARQIWEVIDDCCSIFIAPPSMAELRRRLTGRSTDPPETIELRIKNAQQEMAALDRYQYLIVNDDLDTAAEVLRSVIIAQRSRKRRSPAGFALSLSFTDQDHG